MRAVEIIELNFTEMNHICAASKALGMNVCGPAITNVTKPATTNLTEPATTNVTEPATTNETKDFSNIDKKFIEYMTLNGKSYGTMDEF